MASTAASGGVPNNTVTGSLHRAYLMLVTLRLTCQEHCLGLGDMPVIPALGS